MQRPAGITILAIVDFLSGSFSLLMACVAMAVSSRLAARNAASSSSPLGRDLAFRGNLMFVVGLIGAGASVFKIVGAAGLWTGQAWAQQMALISGTLKLLTHVVAAIRGAITPSVVLSLIVDSAVLVYLLRPRVQQLGPRLQRAFSGVPLDDAATTTTTTP